MVILMRRRGLILRGLRGLQSMARRQTDSRMVCATSDSWIYERIFKYFWKGQLKGMKLEKVPLYPQLQAAFRKGYLKP